MNAQQRAITAGRSVAVMAGAGSGKTHVLVERYVELLRRGLRPMEIVVVTYTERAATELRARIRQRVTQTYADHPDLLAEVEVAQISTIHALAARICRDHPAAASVPSGSVVQDGPDAHLRWEELRDDAMLEVDLPTFGVLEHGRLRRMLQALHQEPHVARASLARRTDDWAALLKRARQEAWDALQRHPRWLAASAQVHGDCGNDGDAIEKSRREAVQGLALIASGEMQRGAALIEGIALKGGRKVPWRDLPGMKEALGTLRELISSPLLTLRYGEGDAALGAQLPLLADAFRVTTDELDRRKRQSRTLEYADLETHALSALRNPEVARHYRRRWRHVMVDEAQDTSPVQTELLNLIGASCDLTVVGDDQQAIYGFRGAGRDALQQLERRVLEAGGSSVTLTEGYRSHNQLQERLNDGARAILGEARLLTASRGSGGTPLSPVSGLISTPEGEADALADHLAQLLLDAPEIQDPRDLRLRPLQARDVAVLARRWSDLDDLRRALTARGVPWFTAGGGDLLRTPEALDTWALLRFLSDQEDSAALLSLLRSPHFGVSDGEVEVLRRAWSTGEAWWLTIQRSENPVVRRAAAVLTMLLNELGALTPRQVLQRTEQLSGYRDALVRLPDAKRHLVDLQACHELIGTLEEPLRSCTEVSVRLTRLITARRPVPRPPPSSGDAVTLSTIHGAKGLEWPVVALAGLGRLGRGFPPALRLDAEVGVVFVPDDEEEPGMYTLLKETDRYRELQEEARLVYVGITRARDALICSAVRQDAPLVIALVNAEFFK
ncbi:UvrD-helicase domain-containing protein [Deinococcus sp. YIM 134068]|uniref:UvrD-helicase domain-containing protein n=1 Tax=Deinococcus lichenicola TaxID=3118910 RepID=UPI002F92F961